MTALADIIAPEARARLLEHLDDEDERELDRLGQLAALMRQVPAQLGPPVPPALHAMARDNAAATATTTERTGP